MVFTNRHISYLADGEGHNYGVIDMFDEDLDPTDAVKCMACLHVMKWDDLIEVEDERE